MNSLLKPFIFSVAWLVLTACSSLPSSQQNVNWQVQQQALAKIKNYSSNGKLNYIDPNERQSLNFQWQTTPTADQFRLTSFLGQTVFLMDVTPTHVQVKNYDNKIYHDTDPSRLLHRLTGMSLPIEEFAQWLLGDPKGFDQYRLNEKNTLAFAQKRINQKEWQFQYSDYKDHLINGKPIPLPHNIKLTTGKTRLTLVINQWRFK